MNDEPRILIVTPSLENRGGVAHYFRSLRAHLGPRVEYLGRGGSGDETRLAGLLRLWSDYRRYARRMRDDHLEIVHLNPSFGFKSLVRDGFFLACAKRSGKKTVVFFRGWSTGCERVVRRCFGPMFRAVIRRADLVVVLGEGFQRALRDLGYRGPIVVETTAVPDEDFAPLQPRPERPERVDVLFLSRIERAKGIYRAIRAHSILRRAHAGVTLTVAGDGSQLQPAKRLVEEQGIPGVTFLGYVHGAEKRRAFQDADLFLAPSSHGEGMPNAVLEAMAHGLPVVARAAGGLADFFEDGRMGFVCEAEDPERIAGTVERLVVDPVLRRSIGEYNRRYAWERFRATRVADRLMALYERLGA